MSEHTLINIGIAMESMTVACLARRSRETRREARVWREICTLAPGRDANTSVQLEGLVVTAEEFVFPGPMLPSMDRMGG